MLATKFYHPFLDTSSFISSILSTLPAKATRNCINASFVAVADMIITLSDENALDIYHILVLVRFF